jgi:septal ring factor EnvC (AmiA/AmiB activator)
MLWLSTPAAAQPPTSGADRIRQQREELDRIRRERADLEQRMRQLRTTVHNLAEERDNLARQADVTARALRSLDTQLRFLANEEEDATARLVRAQDEEAAQRALLRHRVREIYKRGAFYSLEAMLSAESFGSLVARYKYLHLLTLRDRALMRRVEALGRQIASERANLVRLRNDVELSRQEKAEEERRFRALEARSGRSLAAARATERRLEERLQEIRRDEERLSQLLISLSRAATRSNAAPTTSTLRTSDLGRLDWPVEGTILYPFGRKVNPNNTTITWNGIGIAAPLGTPVRAVSGGMIEWADRWGTYGNTVIVNHGGGDYSIYASLDQVQVARGARIAKGQVVGTVGVSDPDLDAHLHFEIRPRTARGAAVDPLDWLRARR